MQAHECSDEELVHRSLTERWCFGLLVGRYEDRLRRYLTRLGRFSDEDLDDLLQNIFVKVYVNLNGFDRSLAFSSWIYRIAHNEAVSYIRHLQARPHGHLVEMSDELMAELLADRGPMEHAEREETTRALARVVEELPAKYRDVVLLKYYEYKTYEEISDILRVPPGTVAVRLNRARGILREHLKRNGYEHA